MVITREQLVSRIIRGGELMVSGKNQTEVDSYFDTALGDDQIIAEIVLAADDDMSDSALSQFGIGALRAVCVPRVHKFRF